MMDHVKAIIVTLCLGVVMIAWSPAGAGITRECDAKYHWKTTGGTYGGSFGNFTGKGGCGSTVPNRCRERARDNALSCMSTHWDIRWENRRPEACLGAQGVHGYNIGLKECHDIYCDSPSQNITKGDIKARLEVEVCCAFGASNKQKEMRCKKDVHVHLNAVVSGDKKCDANSRLQSDYVISDCGAVWDKYCAQSPGQPTGC